MKALYFPVLQSFMVGFMTNSVIHDPHIYNCLILFLVTAGLVLLLIGYKKVKP